MDLRPEQVEYLIVHHTGTARDLTSVEDVRRFHVESRGFDDIGYHFFVSADGALHAGRPLTSRGAHCRSEGMNGRSLGVCVAGHFSIEAPAIAQLMTLTALLRALMAQYGVPPERVLGHREVPGATTVCPGDAIADWLGYFRAESQT